MYVNSFDKYYKNRVQVVFHRNRFLEYLETGCMPSNPQRKVWAWMRSKFHIYCLNKMTRKVLWKLGETFLVENIKDLDVFGQFNRFFINHIALENSCFIFNGSLKRTVSLKLFIKLVRDTIRERCSLKFIELF